MRDCLRTQNGEWKAVWSGKFPCLFNGEWTLHNNDQKVEVEIPFQHNHANTYGEYTSWHFTEDWDTVEETYFDGLSCDDWIQENEEYLAKVTSDANQWPLIFKAFSEQDWRSNPCGGCA